MTIKEAIKLLENKGFKCINQVGSHMKYGKDNYRVTLVCHSSPKGTIHPRTEKNILSLVNTIDKPVYCSNCGLPKYNCTCNIDAE